MKASARIRLLASLDLTGPQLAPVLLRELHGVLAFDSAAYLYPGADGALESYIDSGDGAAVFPTYLDDRIQREERALARPYALAAQLERGPLITEELISVPWTDFVRSSLFNEVLRPAGMLDCVSLFPRDGRGPPPGSIKLYRASMRRRFERHELGELARLEPFLRAALCSPQPATEPPLLQPWVSLGTECLVATAEGRLLWASPQGCAWLSQAFGLRWRVGSRLPQEVELCLQRLRWIREGLPVPGPAELTTQTSYGHFSLRACVLSTPAALAGGSAGQGDDASAVGLQLTKRVHGHRASLDALQALSLPPRQLEVAYWLVRGLPESAIAERLSVSRNTVVFHRRAIYARLGVADREQFQRKLLAGLG